MISLYNITTCSNIQVLRIKMVITKDEMIVLMFVQILLISTIRNIWRTVRRTCMLILVLKELKKNQQG